MQGSASRTGYVESALSRSSATKIGGLSNNATKVPSASSRRASTHPGQGSSLTQRMASARTCSTWPVSTALSRSPTKDRVPHLPRSAIPLGGRVRRGLVEISAVDPRERVSRLPPHAGSACASGAPERLLSGCHESGTRVSLCPWPARVWSFPASAMPQSACLSTSSARSSPDVPGAFRALGSGSGALRDDDAVARRIRSYWDEEDVTFYWEVGDHGWITRHVKLAGPGVYPRAAASLQEWMRELEAGRIHVCQAK